MKNPIDVLLDKSKDWILLPRASSVAEQAVAFLRETFQIEAGILSYGRRPRKSGPDYLRRSKRWYKSWGFETSQPEIQGAIEQSAPFSENAAKRQWFRAEEVPLVWRGILKDNQVQQVGIWLVNLDMSPVGLFVLALKKNRSVSEREAIARCMAHITVVLELVVTRRLSEELSIRDPLTRVLNRRGLLSEFDKLTAQQTPSTVVVVDLDGFKQFNDEQGHIAGDETLLRVADVLEDHTAKANGICSRFGGDEFVIVYRHATEDVDLTAQRVVDKLLDVKVSASAGGAVFRVDGYDFDTCYRIADTRLYEMKKQKKRGIGRPDNGGYGF
ncbi:diguanylate cyclase [Alicyclobacillus sp. SO9]|uniref:GGDEF domain-containing protein n=1 Tax=Alicyclobacillus sp. SO9 TaxID=2665646 RepID=UPI0018E8692D|nr:GGDEF domain-containing protein [Alicyclobacillus sp. SO9]QQE80065.1 GGDEF domain-containing protein [Alicyclobacillus sp. SO9]